MVKAGTPKKKKKREEPDFLEDFFPQEGRELPQLRQVRIDSFEREVLHNMHLELARGDSYVLLSPGLMVLRPAEAPELAQSLKEEEDFLNQVKRCILDDLVTNSAILEGNSYFVEQNYYLTIARLLPVSPLVFELKMYTNTRVDLLLHYSDKIYLGRDQINLVEGKSQFGLPYLLGCIKREYERLRLEARERLRTPRRFHSTLMNEIDELVREIVENTPEYLSIVPRSLDDYTGTPEEIGHINSRNRSMKHLLFELADSVAEYDNLLRAHHETDYAHYLTKFKKDIVNLINLYNIKLIPAFARHANREL